MTLGGTLDRFRGSGFRSHDLTSRYLNWCPGWRCAAGLQHIKPESFWGLRCSSQLVPRAGSEASGERGLPPESLGDLGGDHARGLETERGGPSHHTVRKRPGRCRIHPVS